jgi:hypothetical protein
MALMTDSRTATLIQWTLFAETGHLSDVVTDHLTKSSMSKLLWI